MVLSSAEEFDTYKGLDTMRPLSKISADWWDYTTLDRELLGAFGNGYGETVQMTQDELRAIPDLLRARWLFCRVDAMQRKVPGKHKLRYLLDGVLGPLTEIDANQDLFAGGDWLSAS